MLPLTPLSPALPAEEPAVQLCAFFLGATEYVIDIMRVDEILQPQRCTPVPDAPAWVDGVMNLRGELVPVVDLRRRLASKGSPPQRLKPKWIVALVGRRKLALVVDGVSEVVRVRRRELHPLPPVAKGRHGPSVIGAFGPPDRLRLLLDLRALLAEEPSR